MHMQNIIKAMFKNTFYNSGSPSENLFKIALYIKLKLYRYASNMNFIKIKQ